MYRETRQPTALIREGKKKTKGPNQARTRNFILEYAGQGIDLRFGGSSCAAEHSSGSIFAAPTEPGGTLLHFTIVLQNATIRC